MKKFLLSILMVFSLVGAGIFFAPSASAHDGEVLPLSRDQFNQYCIDDGYVGTTTEGNDPYSVRCVDSSGNLTGALNVDNVCGWVYPGLESPLSRIKTMSETYSAWQCMDIIAYAGAPDLEAWCKSKGSYLNFVGHPNGYNAYGWRCGNQGISVTEVCKCQFGSNALDRVEDIWSDQVYYAWSCYKVRKT